MEYPSGVITGVLLTDKWHDINPGSFHIDQDPSIHDDFTGVMVTPVTGPWLRFTEATTGIVYAAPFNRIQALRSLTGPAARLTATPASGPHPLTVQFDGSASTPGSGPIASYTLDCGDGTTLGPTTGNQAPHTYPNPGVYNTVLTVADANGLTSVARVTITVT